MVRRYFGTDGIRGRANGVITAELALRVGQAAGLVFRTGDHRHRVLIGSDTRLSGYMIENALVAGFTSVAWTCCSPVRPDAGGCHVLTRSMRADLGVMISASHNLDDNGIKLFGPDGYKLTDQIEGKIESLVDSDLTKKLAKGGLRPRQAHRRRARSPYRVRQTHPAARLASMGCGSADCANGVPIASPEPWELGAEVISVGVEPDGFNINQDCGSTAPEELSRKVRRCAPTSALRSTAMLTVC